MSHMGRIIAGAILVLLGVGLALDQAGYWEFGDQVARWWPLALILIGAAQLVTRSAPWFVGVAFLALGGVFLAGNFDVLPSNWGAYVWPAILVLIGLTLLLRPRRRHPRPRRPHGPPLASLDASVGDRVDRTVIFGGFEGASHASPFRGGALTACFGGAVLDLRKATLPAEGADLDATACFGGVEIRVPETWRVEVRGVPLFGGVASKAREPTGTDAPMFRVRGTAIFGGVEINNGKGPA